MFLVLFGGGRSGGRSYARTINPTLGAEIFSDTGLEGTYTSGLCDGLTKDEGSIIVEQSADVHGGSKAQGINPVQSNVGVRMIYSRTTSFYMYTQWAKRVSGTKGTTRLDATVGSGVIYGIPITGAAYTYQRMSYLDTGNGTSFIYLARDRAKGGGGDPVIVDDISLKTITMTSCLATFRAHAENASVQVCVDVPIGLCGGLLMNLDSTSNPQNYVLAYVDRAGSVSVDAAAVARLIKNVGGTMESLVLGAITYVAGAPLRVVNVGDIYKLYYNGTQIGTDQTISDAGVRIGRVACQFATDGDVIFSGYALS